LLLIKATDTWPACELQWNDWPCKDFSGRAKTPWSWDASRQSYVLCLWFPIIRLRTRRSSYNRSSSLRKM
jgi:hypothetical protein